MAFIIVVSTSRRNPASHWCLSAASHRLVEPLNSRGRVRNFYDELIVAVFDQVDDNRALRVHHVPEDAPAPLVEGPGNDQTGNVRPGNTPPLPPSEVHAGICAH